MSVQNFDVELNLVEFGFWAEVWELFADFISFYFEAVVVWLLYCGMM